MRLAGKRVLVTGGAQGMGLAIGLRLAGEGATVTLSDVDAAALQRAQEAFARAALSVQTAVADVSRRDDVRVAVELATGPGGGLDVLVAQAGVAGVGPLLDVDDATWQRLLEVNLTGVFLTVQEGARRMPRGGSIVVTSSTNAFFVEAHTVPYSTTKGGAVTFVRAAALDLAERGIRINAICPGIVRTRLTAVLTEDPTAGPAYLRRVPLGRWGEPEDIASAALFLTSDESSYITGQALTVDGGVSLGVALDIPDGALPGL